MLVELLLLIEGDEDKAIFISMYQRYETKAYAVTMHILHNQHDAEDAAMAAWTKVIDHLETAKKISASGQDFESWLVTVAKNAAMDELRKKKRAPEPVEMWDAPSPENVEKKVETKDVLKRMKMLIRTMPREVRAVLEMRITLGYGFKEIGRSLRCSEDAARKRYEKARGELKKRLGVETV